MDQLREEFKDGYKVQRYKGLGKWMQNSCGKQRWIHIIEY